MKIIITEGLGYIGSHVVLAALDHGYDVTVFDNLLTANKKNIKLKTKFIQGATNSKEDLSKLFANFQLLFFLIFYILPINLISLKAW